MQEISKPNYAGFFVRLAAAAVDGCIVITCIGVAKFFLWITILGIGYNPLKEVVLYQFTIEDILFYVLSSAYYVLLTYGAGATIGKKLMRLEVTTQEGKRLSFMTALYRETVGKYISSSIIFIGYFLIGVDNEKKGLHDILCDTRVIYNLGQKEKNSTGKFPDDTYMKNTYNESTYNENTYMKDTYIENTYKENSNVDHTKKSDD